MSDNTEGEATQERTHSEERVVYLDDLSELLELELKAGGNRLNIIIRPERYLFSV